MTSTVLDVTVMLLCASAAVVALSDPGLTGGTERPDADGDRVADRLTAETATVSVAPADTGNTADGNRTLHATLTELVTTAAWTGSEPFRERADAAVEERVGPRVSVAVRADDGADADGAPTSAADPVHSLGGTPPRRADVDTAVVSHQPPAVAPEAVSRVEVVVRTW